MDPRTGQEPVKVVGVVLGIGLALLILASFSYTFIRWYRRGHCQRREYGRGQGRGGDRRMGDRAGGLRAQGCRAWGVGTTGDGNPWCRGSGPSWEHSEVRRRCTAMSWCCPAACPACPHPATHGKAKVGSRQHMALTPLPPLPHASPGPDFVFNLYHSRRLGSVALELVPPFSISGSLGTSGSGYEPFHNQRP
ncbi:small integral membrane protein 35 isoform X1 [Serinus canaria]|uniref:small integral membrane protein 35 isoform X1 n=1 Tax=Serinus canaria TaxID=9135 RepID=UPI0011AE6B13|nr:small integral membrane protein 35 isoform X1 [Serinus canaria]XP_050839563.1 small integral membrane protein 35 isoform X1 [Serinus canaria]